MEKIPPTMVLHKNLDAKDTIFATMSGPLVKNTLEEWLGVIRSVSYQEAAEDSIWEY